MDKFPTLLSGAQQFEVIARTYSLSKLQGHAGRCNNLTQIGKDLELEDKEIQAIRLRAMAWAKRRPLQPKADDKHWLWPSPSEERQHQAA